MDDELDPPFGLVSFDEQGIRKVCSVVDAQRIVLDPEAFEAWRMTLDPLVQGIVLAYTIGFGTGIDAMSVHRLGSTLN